MFPVYRSNVNYGLNPKPQNQDVEGRTVHNMLYKQQEIPHSASPSHVYNYAAIGINKTTDPQVHVPQHTIVTASTSDAGRHAYSKITTPITNHDRTGNKPFVDTQGYSILEVGQNQNDNNYSALNTTLRGSNLDQGQGVTKTSDEQYSHIDDAPEYSELSEMSSSVTGYSKLDVGNGQATEMSGKFSIAQPYEVPVSPFTDRSDQEEEDVKHHAYSTLAVEVAGDTGYSKLHVFEDANHTAAVNQETSHGMSEAVEDTTSSGK